jgi:hypothetical protein
VGPVWADSTLFGPKASALDSRLEMKKDWSNRTPFSLIPEFSFTASNVNIAKKLRIKCTSCLALENQAPKQVTELLQTGHIALVNKKVKLGILEPGINKD